MLNDINTITHKPKYLIDCSLDKFKQNQTITFSNYNNIEKLLIINHWERTDLPESKATILQAILYDVYGNEHISFNRPSSGNNYDDDINYCALICETIRRIYDAKYDFLPITYIPYGENNIKYIHVDNIYEPINYMLLTLKQHQLYVKNYQRNIEIPYQLYGLKVLRSAFSSLKGIAEDENYEYYYYDGLKKIYIFDKKEYGLVDSFPIIDKYFQGNTSLDDIREIMTYYKQPQQFINQLHELNYLSDKVHKKIMKILK